MNPYMENLNYYNDSRVQAGSIDRGKSTEDGEHIEFVTETDDGEEITHLLPTKFAVCGTCDGKGTHVNPSIDCGGLSREDFDEDPDFEEGYRSGAYDVSCYECKGKRVVAEIDEKRCDKVILEQYYDDLQEQYDDYAVRAAERRMGA